MRGALDGVRILDLSRQLPGPFCSMMLGDLGADVIVIAAPNDPLGVGLPLLGRNKRHMTLNLKDEDGQHILYRMLGSADVLLEGFRPGVTAKLGIDYERAAKHNHRLVYCSISGYGQEGPYRDRVGHDINYVGYAGILSVTGAEPKGPPVIPGVQIADIGGGALMGVIGILAALMARERTGRGQFVDISMLDGCAAWNVFHLLLHLIGQDPGRGESRLTGRYPCYAVYETKDGKWVTVGALEPHFWKNLCEALAKPEWIPDQFVEGERLEEMWKFFRRVFRSKTQAEWLERFDGVDICFGPVNSIGEMLADPQLRARGMIVQEEHPSFGRFSNVGCPIRLTGTPPRTTRPPCAFGQHTEGILQELGYAGEDISTLRQRGVV